MVDRVDVMIIGGGVIGSVLALALSRAHFTVALVEGHIPDHSQDSCGRVTALYYAGCQILRNLDILDRIPVEAIGLLRRFKVWDEQGGGAIEFDSADVGLAEWGRIFENEPLLQAVQQQLRDAPEVRLYYGSQPVRLEVTETEATLFLEHHACITASLIVGADGKNSWVRQQSGIRLQRYSYEQKAWIAQVHVAKMHQYTGWQAFLERGPIALLPLGDVHHCGVVWSCVGEKTAADMEKKLNEIFSAHLGPIQVISVLHDFPLWMQHAHTYWAARTVLVGDAAHVIHPLAGLGANIGLLDAMALVDCLRTGRAQHQNLGSSTLLRKYERCRKSENQAVIHSMRGLHELFTHSHPLAVLLRSQGLNALNRFACIKKRIIQRAIGYPL